MVDDPEMMTEVIYEKQHDDGKGSFDVRLNPHHRANVVLRGRGSVSGLNILVDAFNEIDAMVGDKLPKTRVFVDLTQLLSAPLRSQFILGKWLLARRDRVGKVAVFGGKPFLMKLARAVMTIARIRNVGFFSSAPEAERYIRVAQ